MRTTTLLSSTLALCFLSHAVEAQVTHWRMVKGPTYAQTADNTQPVTASSWSVFALLQTADAADAASVTLSGGGIVGSLPFEKEGDDWVFEADHATQLSLNGVFPSSTSYTITLSGGTLGTLTQTVSLGAEQYPNIPYLTGSVFSDLANVDPTVPLSLTWNDPGPLTVSNGVSVLEIYDEFDNEVFFELVIGGASAASVPANTMTLPEYGYNGFLEFTNAALVSGSGGFGIDGTTSHNVALDFVLQTYGAAVVMFRNAGTNPSSYVASPPVIGSLWSASVDVTTSGHSHAQVLGFAGPASVPIGAGGQVQLVGGPKLFTLPLKPGPVASWALPIPPDPTLAGLTLYTQAVHLFGAGSYALSNAQDLVAGY